MRIGPWSHLALKGRGGCGGGIDTFRGLPGIIQTFINEPMVLGTEYAHWGLVPFGV
jgi:hypothetical protein